MLSVDFRDGLLSVQAKQGVWTKILNEVSRKTGILFHGRTSLERSVNLSFKDLPLKRALEYLFGPEANVIVRYEKAPDSAESIPFPKEVWVLGKVETKSSETPHGRGVAKADPEPRATADEYVEAEDEASDQHEQIDQLVEMTQNDDPALRAQTLSALSAGGKADEATVRSALEAALSDEDASVRGQAVQIVVSRGGPEAMGLLGQALHDSDASVRLMAADSVVPDDEGIALLQEALSDADETVRYLAALKLRKGGIESGNP